VNQNSSFGVKQIVSIIFMFFYWVRFLNIFTVSPFGLVCPFPTHFLGSFSISETSQRPLFLPYFFPSSKRGKQILSF